MLPRFIALLLCLAVLPGAGLPENGPVPDPKPETATEEKPVEPAPAPAESLKKGTTTGEKETPVEPVKPEVKLEIAGETDAEHAACTASLKAIGAVFSASERIDEGNGCGIDRPITVTEILPGTRLEPEGKMRCETALTLAEWTRDSVIPAAAKALPEAGKLTVIHQASTYICRLRNNAETGKISEHARGNAVDIASFGFEKGEPVTVEPRAEDGTLTGAFQRTVSASACLYFKTVLAPGSDAAHENHLHLDVLVRKGDYRYCR